MITFKKYRDFLEEMVAQGICSCRVDQIEERKSDPNLFILKHDVETNLLSALKLAQIESECGHVATYYFQGDLLMQAEAYYILREISELGHEVAYHYDVLDSCNGDYAAATLEFDRFKTIIESHFGLTLRTVCPHGNPTKLRKGWNSNKDFFRAGDIRQRYPQITDIVVDFDVALPNGIYISDAGFALRRIGNISGNDKSNEAAIADGTTIGWSDLGSLVRESRGVILSVHSHRLRESALLLYFLRLRMNVLRAGYQIAKKIPIVESVANRFYAIARRF